MIAEVAITPRSSTTPSITKGVPDDESVLDDVEDSVAEDGEGADAVGDDTAGGHINEQGVRHESATSLTFPDASFDRYLSFDVFEHIPDYSKAFKEAARVLRPGGKLVFTVPFNPGLQEHQIRAQVLPDGEIEHILPPEYHGDPMSQAGVLCFQIFGWDILDDLKHSGFETAAAYLYYSRQYGYLGELPVIFEAAK